MEKVKIRTKKGRIITLSIEKKSETHLFGYDKFNCYTVIAIDDIDSTLNFGGEQ